MKALKTNEINNIMAKNLPSHVQYLGTVPSNKWPPHIPYKKASAFISNTMPDSHGGMHWISCFVDSSGKGSYFDSYAQKMPHKEWYNWFQKHTRSFDMSRKPIQRQNTASCGYFCIYFLMHKCMKPHIPNDILMRNVTGRKAYMYVQSLKK